MDGLLLLITGKFILKYLESTYLFNLKKNLAE